MHELMVAQSLLTSITAEAEKQNAKPLAAGISCGIFNAINDDTLLFAFEAIAKGTICEGVKLNISHKPIQARCKNCQNIFEFNIVAPACTNCGGSDFELMPDPPLLLEEIEFDTE